MKRLIALVVLLRGSMSVLWAADECDQHLSRGEFQNRQKALTIKQVGLTKREAARFFPVYFELQEKKERLNDESWSLMCQDKDDKTTEVQYEEVVAKVCDNHIAADRSDRSHLDRFRKTLPNKEIFLAQRAEMCFYREMLKGMNRKDRGNDPERKK